MKQHALANAQPLAVYLELTYHCNWRCVFCYNPRHTDVRPMSATEWIAVLDDLRTLGAFTLTLTGGEPLTHPEFFSIAGAARERGFAIRIFTNGALIDGMAADRIAALHPESVQLSIHGATAGTHDLATRHPGSFFEMWRGIDHLVGRDIRVSLKSSLTRLNEHELEDLIDLVAGRGLPLHIDPALTPRDDGDPSPLSYLPSPDAVRRLMRKQLVAESLHKVERVEGGVNCGLGRLTTAIDPEGNVYPCIQWRKSSLGNVRQSPLRELWKNSPVREEAAAVATAVNDHLIRIGGPLSEFPFCPALADQRTGTVFEADEGIRDRADLAATIRRELAR